MSDEDAQTVEELKTMILECLVSSKNALEEGIADYDADLSVIIEKLRSVALAMEKNGKIKELDELVDKVTLFTAEFSNPESPDFINIPNHLKLNIVWDLDLCLLQSVEISRNEDKSLHTTVVETFGGPTGKANLHVDDDLYRYKTYLRGWCRFVLFLLKPFCNQFVYTSASGGYMKNVVCLVEGLSDTGCVKIFEDRMLSSTNFPPGHLKLHGKAVAEFAPELTLDGEKHFRTDRCILVDDQARYHSAQPYNGVQVNIMQSMRYSLTDFELLDSLSLFWRLVHSKGSNFYKALHLQQGDKYWAGILIGRVRVAMRSEEEAALVPDNLGSARESDKWKFCLKYFGDYLKNKLSEIEINNAELEAEIIEKATNGVEMDKDLILEALNRTLYKLEKREADET